MMQIQLPQEQEMIVSILPVMAVIQSMQEMVTIKLFSLVTAKILLLLEVVMMLF